MDTALVQNEGHMSKVKVTRSYYVQIGHAADMVFYVICAWLSTHCHTWRLPSQYVYTRPSPLHPLMTSRSRLQGQGQMSRKRIFGEGVYECLYYFIQPD